MKVIYEDKIRECGEKLINNYKKGLLKGGVNGPYNDPETEVRNMAHLAIIIAIEILSFKQKKLIPTLENIGKYFLNNHKNGLYIMRLKENKDPWPLRKIQRPAHRIPGASSASGAYRIPDGKRKSAASGILQQNPRTAPCTEDHCHL